MGRRRTQIGALTLAALLALLGLAGCAGPGGGGAPQARSAVPADAPAELDFLMAREFELDGELEDSLGLYLRALSKDPSSPELLRKVAELSARLNHLEDAVGYAERALVLDPDDDSTRLFLGTLYRFQRNRAAAERILRDPESGEPRGTDEALLLFGVLSDAKDYAAARAVAEWLIETDPEGLRGYFALAGAYEESGDVESAERTLRAGLRAHPGEIALYGALARGRRDRGDREGEIVVYREILAQYPEHHITLLALAEAQLASGDADGAVETLEQLERTHPDDLRSILRLGFVEFERENYEAARQRFEHALEVNPEQFEVAYFLGVVDRRLGDDEAAIVEFERIPESHDRYAEARTQIAAIYEQRKDYAAAVAEVERARGEESAKPLDLYLASLRAKAGDFDGAVEFLETMREESPDDAEVIYNLGVIHGEARQVDRALVIMQEALAADPEHAGALNYVGYTLAERGTDLDQAEAYITRALELRPDDGFITDSLGWVYYMRARPLFEEGRREEGMVYVERALEKLELAESLTGGDPVISEHLGDVYLLLGEKERALEKYDEALAQNPREAEQPDLQQKYDQLHEELGGS